MFVFFALASQVFAQGFVPLAPIPGLTEGVVANEGGLAQFLNNLYKFLIGIAAVLAIIMIIWGGLQYSTQDSVSEKGEGKQRIYDAIFGLILVLSPVLVFSIINPSILNLSINMEPLDTQSGIPANSGGTPTITTDEEAPHENMMYPCTTSDCSVEQTTCEDNDPGAMTTAYTSVVCVKADGSVDPKGRTDNPLNPIGDPECVAGETLSLSCVYGTDF